MVKGYRGALGPLPHSGTMSGIKLVLFLRLENSQEHLSAKALLSSPPGKSPLADLLNPES